MDFAGQPHLINQQIDCKYKDYVIVRSLFKESKPYFYLFFNCLPKKTVSVITVNKVLMVFHRDPCKDHSFSRLI